jgi:hypothetical protein
LPRDLLIRTLGHDHLAGPERFAQGRCQRVDVCRMIVDDWANSSGLKGSPR